jgi:hypothetical protein
MYCVLFLFLSVASINTVSCLIDELTGGGGGGGGVGGGGGGGG